MMLRWLLLPLALVAPACGPSTECTPTPGRLCTLVGTGFAGLGGEGQPGHRTPLYQPQDVTVAPDGRLYVLDFNNHRVRVREEDGTMRTVVGTGELGDADGDHAHHVSLNHPTHVTFAPDGRMVLSAWHNSKVVWVDLATGALQPLCGTGRRAFGGDGGPATAAYVDLPVATAFAPDGALYVADQANQRIRRVGTDGVITTVVGTGEPGFAGDGGPALQAQLQGPMGQAASPSGKIATDAAGNLYIADSGNQRVRKVTPDGTITTVAGNGETGSAPPFGDGGPATAAQLSRPTDVAVGPDGSLYIADTDHSCVRRVDPAGVITTVAGRCGESGNGEDGPPTEVLLHRPFGVEVDARGVLYIADTYNHRIRALAP